MTTQSPHPQTVIFVHASDELYGSDRVLLDILGNLDRTRVTPIVVLPNDVPSGGALSKRLRSVGIEVHTRPLAVLRRRYMTVPGLMGLGWRMLCDVVWLARLSRRRSAGCVYSNTAAVQSGALAASVLGVRHVWHVHEIVEKPAVVARILRFTLRRFSTDIIAVSEAVAKWIASPSVPVHVIHNGIDRAGDDSHGRAAWRLNLLAGRGGPLVGWVGRLSAWKGYETFVAMAEAAAPSLPGAVFVLAGEAPAGTVGVADMLQHRISISPAANQIRYVGEVPDGAALIAALDVLVACPTRPDPLPRVVQEALIGGVPVLAVRTGGLPELVVDGRTGILVDAPDAGDLAHALTAMVEGSRLRSLSEAARYDAIERFGMTQFIERIQSLLVTQR